MMWPNWYQPKSTAFWNDKVNAVADIYHVKPEEITGRSRKMMLVDARWVCAKALRAKGRLSFPQIARILNRDHTTIVHACHNFHRRAATRQQMHTALLKVLA